VVLDLERTSSSEEPKHEAIAPDLSTPKPAAG